MPHRRRNLINHKRYSAPVRQAVFLCLNFADRFSLPLKSDLKKLNVERARNTIPERGITPAVLVAVFEPLGTLFR
nr:MAG TPA: hypothetical protein [Caudoviricetes sp.]